VNIGARLVSRKYRTAYISAQKYANAYAQAEQKLASAKTPAQIKAAENAIQRASAGHHAAMGKLPLHLQIAMRLK
jgi:7,8-dihydro-6-hydroxymethylpterin-pyrophosphokinase